MEKPKLFCKGEHEMEKNLKHFACWTLVIGYLTACYIGGNKLGKFLTKWIDE